MQIIPGWHGAHPLVVHFPIALLLVAPVLAAIGLALKKGRTFLFAALVVMVLGTAGAWLALASGEAAGELAERVAGVEAVLEKHAGMAETTTTVFTVLTLVYAALLVAPWALKRQMPRIAEIGIHGGFLAVYAAGAVYLAQTAHQGGMLVHQYGVHALQNAPPSAQPPGALRGAPDDDD